MRRRHSIAALLMILAVFMVANAPTPLYARWQTEFGFSSVLLTIIFAAYIVGMLGSLLLSGQLSDHFGRKPLLVPGASAAIAACLLFMVLPSAPALVLARFLSGIAVGVALSVGIAAMVDMAGASGRGEAARWASTAVVFGAAAGPLWAGLVAEFSPRPELPLFAPIALLLLAATMGALLLPLYAGQRDSEGRHMAFRLRWPGVPSRYRPHLMAGIAMCVPAFTTGAFLSSLGSSILARSMQASSPLLAGSLAFVMMIAATATQMLARRSEIASLFLWSSSATIAAMLSLIAALFLSLPGVLVLAALLIGAGVGLAQLGSLTLIGTNVPDGNRAEANALLNFGGYAPVILSQVATGFLIDMTGLRSGITAFATTVMVAALAGLLFAFRTLQTLEDAEEPLSRI